MTLGEASSSQQSPRGVDTDVEMHSPSDLLHPDPYSFRDGLKTDDELAEIRRRNKTGKKVEKYHRKQNDVRTYIFLPFQTLISFIAHCFSVETHGRSYPRSQSR